MNNNRRIFVFVTLLAIPLIIFVCLLMVGVNCGNKADTAEGESYLDSLDGQDTQYLEHSMANTTAPTQAATEPSTENNTAEDVTEPSVEGSTEPSTDVGSETEPATPAPTEPKPTTPVTPPPTQGEIIVAGQSVIPYEVDEALLASTLTQLDNGTLTMKSVYANSLFVGDSITSGFDVYSIVNSSNVIASVGANMKDHLSANLGTIVQYNPKYLFLHYGLNEMNPSEAGVNTFIAKYRENINYLKANLPYTKIIVLSLSPVGDAAMQKQPRFAWIPTYNDRMRAMCQELGVGFHQNDAFFSARMHLYGQDGIHFKPELYRQWIRLITEEMGLY